jgi:hypothetical protein
MNSWPHLNVRGKLLAVLCGVNVGLAIFSGMNGDTACFFNFFCGMVCGVATYSPKCVKTDHENECKNDGEVF